MRVRIVNAGKSMDISLPCSDMELNFAMKRAGNRETVPRCRLLSVVDEANPLTMLEGSTVNMDEVNFFAKRMESLTEYERSCKRTELTCGCGKHKEMRGGRECFS